MANASANAASDTIQFYDVLVDEARILTARRLGRTEPLPDPMPPGPGPVGVSRDPALVVRVSQLHEGDRPVFDERDHPVPCMESDTAVVGLSLSGGGVRSASFALGVLQGLDAVVPDDAQPQLLDAVDYLSTVSGGGYMGASLVTGMMRDGRFPFTSKFDQMETAATQHLRDYSNYIAPRGGMDWVVGAVVLLRGLLLNALLVGGLVLLAAAATVAISSDEGRLGTDRVPGLHWNGTPFLWTGIAFSAFILLQLPAVAKPFGLSPSASLAGRERVDRKLAFLLLCVAFVLFLDMQSFVLKGLFDAVHLSACRAAHPRDAVQACGDLADRSGRLGLALSRAGLGSGAPWASLAAAVAALGAFGSKLVKVAGATFGDRSWSGFLMHWGSRIAVAVGSLLVPLAIWAVYLSACFHAIPGASVPPSHRADAFAIVYLLVGLGFLIACFSVPANANSLHGFYRDRLSRAFLGDGDALDATRLTDLLPAALGGSGHPRDGRLWTPYLLVNTAVNVEGSRYVNKRGRNADSFIFSPLHSGSEVTDYIPTATLQERDGHVDVATAMAISGAAASANMGASTIRPLTFSLAVLNIRLGYWLPNPRSPGHGEESWFEKLAQRLERHGPHGAPAAEPSGARLLRWLDRSWPVSFAREAAGALDETCPMVYLTDGGHFDNLGIYELLKRRCKVIVAADAEADLPMNFESLIRLERCARIDLGVRIDLPWEDLRRWSRRITVEEPHGPKDDPAACGGPHVALGRIRYTDEDVGLLVYVKACVTGDENDLIRDYRRRNPDFPHETTLDQFFTEEQFEAYRALGFHAANSFFLGRDRFSWSPSQADADWTSLVETALKRLNVPAAAVARIVAQQSRPAEAPDVHAT